MAYVKRIFFGPSSQNLIAGHQVTGGGSDKELLLDPSTGPVIRIPADLPTPSERNEKPREYWTLYYEAESHYKRGRYDLAKSELVKLETISPLHPASRVLRLRTYRKLITMEKKKVVSENAIALCEEMFASCVDEITDTDRRTYNQLLERLPTSSSLAGTPKLWLVSKMDAPDFEVVDQAEERVKNVLVCEIPAKEVREEENGTLPKRCLQESSMENGTTTRNRLATTVLCWRSSLHPHSSRKLGQSMRM